jgi:hypothetical protein
MNNSFIQFVTLMRTLQVTIPAGATIQWKQVPFTKGVGDCYRWSKGELLEKPMTLKAHIGQKWVYWFKSVDGVRRQYRYEMPKGSKVHS